jgi:hypothetical protein
MVLQQCTVLLQIFAQVLLIMLAMERWHPTAYKGSKGTEPPTALCPYTPLLL